MTEQAQAVQRITGRCKRWNPGGNCGFLIGHDNGKWYFVHQQNLLGVSELAPGVSVEFNAIPARNGEKNERAVNVVVL